MSSKVTRLSLVRALEDEHTSYKERLLIISAVFKAFTALFCAGKNINIKRVGRLTVSKKGARPGRNPKTGEEVVIKPRTTVTLTKSKTDRPTAGIAELIDQIIYSANVEGVELTKAKARKVLMLLWDAIASVKEGNCIEIRGFGVFSHKNVPAHYGRNPKTGKRVFIEGYTKIHFKVSPQLVEMLS